MVKLQLPPLLGKHRLSILDKDIFDKDTKKEGVSLFIGLRGINGTLTAFLGLLTDFKRKLDLAVVAIPPKAGMQMRQPNGRKAKSV